MFRRFMKHIFPESESSNAMSINQSGLEIRGSQYIAGNNIILNFDTLEKYATAGVYAFYNIFNIVLEMTEKTEKLSGHVNILTNELTNLLKCKSNYPREVLIERKDLILKRMSVDLKDFGNELELACISYQPNIEEVERSIIEFITSRRFEMQLYRDEVLLFIHQMDTLGNSTRSTSNKLVELINAMSDITMSSSSIQELNDSVNSCRVQISNLTLLFNETSATTTRIRRFLGTLM